MNPAPQHKNRLYSSYRNLVPYYTTAPVNDINLVDALPTQSPFRTFAASLQSFEDSIDTQRWTDVVAPKDVLKDVDPEDVLNAPLVRKANGRLYTPLQEGLLRYTVATRFYDSLVWCTGDRALQERVPVHLKYESWVGHNPILDMLGDLQSVVADIITWGKGVSYQVATTGDPDQPRVVRLLQEAATSRGLRKAGRVAQNLATIALYFSFLMEGKLDIPTSFSDIELTPAQQEVVESVARLMRTPKLLRQPAYLAALLTPLVALLAVKLTDSWGLEMEDVLLNLKQLGNNRPLLLKELERDLWDAIIAILVGQVTALGAVRRLADKWEEMKVLERLTPEVRYFFKREKKKEWSPSMSIFTTLLKEPVPSTWPLSDMAKKCVYYEERHLPTPSISEDPSRTSNNESNDSCNEQLIPAQTFASLISNALHSLDDAANPGVQESEIRARADVEVTEMINPGDLLINREGDEVESANIRPSFTAGERSAENVQLVAHTPQSPETINPALLTVETSDRLNTFTPHEEVSDAGNSDSVGSGGEAEVMNQPLTTTPKSPVSSAERGDSESLTSQTPGTVGIADSPLTSISTDSSSNSPTPIIPRHSLRLAVQASKKELEPPKSKAQAGQSSERRGHRAIKSKAVVSSDEDNPKTTASLDQPRRVVDGPAKNDADILEALERDGFALVTYNDFYKRKPEIKPVLRRQVATLVKHEEVPQSAAADVPKLERKSDWKAGLDNVDTFELEGEDTAGSRHTFRPIIVDKKDRDFWAKLADATRDSPKHERWSDRVSEQKLDKSEIRSSICIMTAAEFDKASTEEIQARLRDQNLVVRDSWGLDVDFDLKGLATVADVDSEADIQDLTQSVSDEDLSSRLRTGTLRQILQAQDSTTGDWIPLNGIAFPNHYASVMESAEASDFRAIRRTADDFGGGTVLNSEDVQFSLVGTPNAFHYVHMDPRGNGTWVRISCGEKWWYILRFRDARKEASMIFWSDRELDIRQLNLDDFIVEVVVLRRGDRLVQRAAQLHAVFTAAPSICHGGYFLAASTIKRTLLGCIHSFFEGRVVTNSECRTVGKRVNALIALNYRHYILNDRRDNDIGHVVNLKTIQGVEDLLCLAIFAEVQNLLAMETYAESEDEEITSALSRERVNASTALTEWDISNISEDERITNVYGRGKMTALVTYADRFGSCLNELGEAVDLKGEVLAQALSQLLYGIERYYGKSQEVMKTLIPEHLLRHQLGALVGESDKIHDEFKRMVEANEDVEYFLPDNFLPSGCRWQWRDENHDSVPPTAEDIWSAGLRECDLLYFSNLTSLRDNQRDSHLKQGNSKKRRWMGADDSTRKRARKD